MTRNHLNVLSLSIKMFMDRAKIIFFLKEYFKWPFVYELLSPCYVELPKETLFSHMLLRYTKNPKTDEFKSWGLCETTSCDLLK